MDDVPPSDLAATVAACRHAGIEPRIMGIGPVPAVRKAMLIRTFMTILPVFPSRA
jgi:acetyl-CoA acetyltransferase